MKYLKTFENNWSDEFGYEDYRPKRKYKIGDYVRYTKDKSLIYMINDVDEFDTDYPYYIESITGSDNIDDNSYHWTSEYELYTDEETEMYQNQNKYNL